jgi:hypothetical protein
MPEPPDGPKTDADETALAPVGASAIATADAEVEVEGNQWRSLRDRVWDGRYVADMRARYCMKKAKANGTYQKIALFVSLTSQSGTILTAFTAQPWVTTSLAFIAAVVSIASVAGGWNAQQAKFSTAASQFQDQHSAWDRLWRLIEFSWPPDDFERLLNETVARDNQILAAVGEPGDVKLIRQIQREINAAMNPQQLAGRNPPGP